jgi:hypothetical protein
VPDDDSDSDKSDFDSDNVDKLSSNCELVIKEFAVVAVVDEDGDDDAGALPPVDDDFDEAFDDCAVDAVVVVVGVVGVVGFVVDAVELVADEEANRSAS